MKKMMLVILAIAFFASPALAFNSDWANVTTDGTFYLDERIADELGYFGATVGYIYDHSTQKGTEVNFQMERKNGYLVYESGTSYNPNTKYSFAIEFDGSNHWFPHEVVKEGYQGQYKVKAYNVNASSKTEPLATDNTVGGFNTTTYPVEKAPF